MAGEPGTNTTPELDGRPRPPPRRDFGMVWWGALVVFALAVMLMNG